MCRYCILIFFVFLALFSFGQTQNVEDLKGKVSSIGNSINKGFTEKAWKKEQESWKAQIESASDITGVSASLISLNGFFNQKAKKSEISLSESKSIEELTRNLFALSSSLKKEAIGANLTDITTVLKKSIDQYDADKAKAVEAAEAKAQMKPFVDAFSGHFVKLFVDSKKARFKNSAGLECDGKKVSLLIGEEDTYRAEIKFDCGSDQAVAKDLCLELQKVVDQKVPSSYKMSRDFSQEFSASIYAKVWEFQAEKFADMAKQPTVGIGVSNEADKYTVIIRIIEPVFRR
jgi:hypothetical protein